MRVPCIQSLATRAHAFFFRPGAGFSAQFRDFISLCLQKEAEQRPLAQELLAHAFIRLHDDALIPFDMAGFVKGVAEMRHVLRN